MNEHLDFHPHQNGYRVTYCGRQIWAGNTWTGACRAMIAFREDLAELLLQTQKGV